MLIRCYDCEQTVDLPEDSLPENCPGCGSTAKPHDPANDVVLTLNTHDVRVLTIWADNFARKNGLGLMLEPVLRRVRRQLLEPMALTLAEEMQGIRDAGFEAELYEDGRRVYPHE